MFIKRMCPKITVRVTKQHFKENKIKFKKKIIYIFMRSNYLIKDYLWNYIISIILNKKNKILKRIMIILK